MIEQTLLTDEERDFIRLIARELAVHGRDWSFSTSDIECVSSAPRGVKIEALLGRMCDLGLLECIASDGTHIVTPALTELARRIEQADEAKKLPPDLVEQYRKWASSHPRWSKAIIWGPVAYFVVSFLNEVLTLIGRFMQ